MSKYPKWLGLPVFAFILVLAGAVAEAQQPKKVPRIGYLSAGDATRQITTTEAIRLGLRDLGYIEGQNIGGEYRYAEGKRERYAELAAELVRLKVEIIVVTGGNALVRAAKDATKTIPIVMVGPGLDPVEAGLVTTLAHPGGNITGITNISSHLGGKRLDLLKEAVPNLARIAVLYDPAVAGGIRELREVLPVAARAGLTVHPREVRSAEHFERAFAALNQERLDGLYVTSSPLMNAHGKRIARFALTSRIASTYGNRQAVNDGGLIYYGADLADIHRRVAYYVDKILKGTKPANLPVEQPTKFELIINLKSAKQIGLTVPPNVLARADRVIK